MKIGDKVIVDPKCAFVDVLGGKAGVVIENQDSASYGGTHRWIVKFDQPVYVYGAFVPFCDFREDELILKKRNKRRAL